MFPVDTPQFPTSPIITGILYVMVMILGDSIGVADETTRGWHLPFVANFESDELGSDARIFGVAKCNRGLIYLAIPDESSVLVGNGNSWQRIEMEEAPLGIASDPQGRVWVSTEGSGAGWFETDRFGQPIFHRFHIELNEDDVRYFYWCFPTQNGVRLSSKRIAVEIDTSKTPFQATIHRALEGETFTGVDGDTLFVSREDNFNHQQVAGSKRLDLPFEYDRKIDFTTQLTDGSLVLAADSMSSLWKATGDGLQPFSEEFNQHKDDAQFSWAIPLSANRFGCANNQGFFCFDANGSLLYHLGAHNGLLSDRVDQFGEFDDGRIWLTYAGGNFSTLSPTSNLLRIQFSSHHGKAAIFDLLATPEKILAATNVGLFELEQDNNGRCSKIEKISASAVGSIHGRENEVFACDNFGVYQLINNELRQVKNEDCNRVYIFEENTALLFGGDYRVDIAHWTGDNFETFAKYELGFLAKRIIPGSGRIWVLGQMGELAVIYPAASWSQGAKVTVQKELSVIGLFAYNGKTIGWNSDGLFQLDVVDHHFKLSPLDPLDSLHKIFEQREIQKVSLLGKDRLLLMDAQLATLHTIDDGRCNFHASKQWILPPDSHVGSMCVDRNSVVWFESNGQLARFDSRLAQNVSTIAPLIQSHFDIEQLSDESTEKSDFIQLQASGNASFRASIPIGNFGNFTNEFRYRLEGLEEWSDWTTKVNKEYERLPGGTYRFEIQTRDYDQKILTFSGPRFHVATPWHSTWSAYSLYAILMAGCCLLGLVWRGRKLKATNRRMEQLVAQRTAEIERKRLELEQKSKQLIDQDRSHEANRLASLHTLIGGIAHDFNNILTSLNLTVEMMVISENAKIPALAGEAQKSIEFAAGICRELSTIAGTSPLKLQPYALGSLLRELEPILKNLISESIDFAMELENIQDDSALVDINLLKRAILNLVVNASEAAQSSVRLQLSGKRLSEDDLRPGRFVGNFPESGDYVCLTVSDDGPGIDSKIVDRLFDPFVSSKEFGRGLGLAVVMKTIGRHRGVIFVESEPGRTAFRVCLPRSSKHHPKIPTPHFDFSSKGLRKLLLVEDDLVIAKSNTRILKSAGYEVITVHTANDGFKAMSVEPSIEMLITDVMLPDMNGDQMARKILNDSPQLPILFVSGFSPQSMRPDVLERDQSAFIAKPYSTEQFLSEVRSLWNRVAASKR